jgi:hypothetical protein
LNSVAKLQYITKTDVSLAEKDVSYLEKSVDGWQIGDKNATLGRFIEENEKMRRKIERNGIVY